MRTLVLILLAAGVAGAAPKPTPILQKFAEAPAPAPLRASTPEGLAQALTAIDARLAAALPRLGVTALAAGLVADGKLAWAKGYGVRDHASKAPVDADSVFRIGSITKTFTSLTLLALRDEGRLSFDVPAATWLPELANVVYPTKDSPPITLRHLVTHTSGLPRLGTLDYWSDTAHALTEAQLLKAIDGVVLERAPGTGENYSNLAVALAGVIAGRVAGKPYRDVVSQRILKPLGMSATTWDREQVPTGRLAIAYGKDGTAETPHWRLGAGEGMGGLYSSVADMAKYALFELGAWPPRSEADAGPVKRTTVRESQRGFGPTTGGSARGAGWGLEKHPSLGQLVWHNGGANDYTSSLALIPARGLGIVLLTAGDTDDLDDLARELLALVPPPQVEVPPALAGAAAMVRGWTTRDTTAAEFEKAIAPGWLKDLSAASWVDFFRGIRTGVGSCTRAEAVGPSTRGGFDFRLACEKGSPALWLAVDPEGRIAGLSIR